MTERHEHSDSPASIVVIGVGGAGVNAVNNMITAGLKGVRFVVANTDVQSLNRSLAPINIQLGAELTSGRGAGARPEIGRQAAEDTVDQIRQALQNAQMVFVTTGMGGGTGTGAAPVVARIAREMGILTVGVASTPFAYEGVMRAEAAAAGIKEFEQFVDTLIVIPNQNLFHVIKDDLPFQQALKLADQVLLGGIACITDLITREGLINLDFADISLVMSCGGAALMGSGQASGPDRAITAANNAIINPLLANTALAGAQGLLISVSGSDNMSLREVEAAVMQVRRDVDEAATMIFGASIDEELGDEIRVSVIATGQAVVMQSPASNDGTAQPAVLGQQAVEQLYAQMAQADTPQMPAPTPADHTHDGADHAPAMTPPVSSQTVSSQTVSPQPVAEPAAISAPENDQWPEDPWHQNWPVSEQQAPAVPSAAMPDQALHDQPSAAPVEAHTAPAAPTRPLPDQNERKPVSASPSASPSMTEIITDLDRSLAEEIRLRNAGLETAATEPRPGLHDLVAGTKTWERLRQFGWRQPAADSRQASENPDAGAQICDKNASDGGEDSGPLSTNIVELPTAEGTSAPSDTNDNQDADERWSNPEDLEYDFVFPRFFSRS